MPSINLIASRREVKKRQAQNIKKILYVIAGEIGVIVLGFMGFSVQFLQTRNHVGDLNEQLSRLQPRVTQIKDLQAQTLALSPKVKTLDGAKEDTLFWYANLYAITKSLPPKTWLTTLNTGGAASPALPGTISGADPTMDVSGVATSQASVGKTMQLMNQQPSLDHVDLSSVTAQKTGQIDTVSFQMTVHLKPEPDAVPKGKGGDPNAQKS